MDGLHYLYAGESLADDLQVGWIDVILDLQRRAVRFSHQVDQCLRFLEVGDRDRFDERWELTYHPCGFCRGYNIAAPVEHTHDESHGIAFRSDCTPQISKAGGSTEFNLRG